MEKAKKDTPFGFKSLFEDLKLMLKYRELLVLSFAIFVSMIGFGLIMPFLPKYARDYGATKTQVGFMMGLFAVVRIFFSPLGGWLADKIGRKPLMVLGMFMYTLVMFLFGTADSVAEIFLYRGAQGAASGLVWPIAMTYIGDIVKEDERGKAMGLYSITFASGNAVGPIMGGVIASKFSLSYAFYGTSLLALISGLMIFFGVKESYKGQIRKKTRKQSALSILKDFNLKKITPHPKTFLGLTVGSFTVFFGLAMFFPMLPLFGNEILGFNDMDIALMFTAMGIIQVLFMFPAGSLADRVGHKKMILTGSLISSVFCGVIAIATGFYSLLFIVILYTMGRSIARPSFPAFVTSLTPTQHRGKGMGIYTFAQNLSWAFGSVASGIIADSMGLRFPFVVALVIGLIGVGILLFTVDDLRSIKHN